MSFMLGATVSVLLVLGASAGGAFAQISYVGSSTIGEHIIPAAAKVFTQHTGIPFGVIQTQGSGKGLEMVLRGEASLAGVSRPLTPAEKQRRTAYQIIGYDAVGVFVHPSNPVTSLTKQQLKAIFSGRISNWREVGGANALIVCITQIWGAKRAQMVEFQDHVMDGASYRDDRKEVDKQSDQVAALLGEPRGITAVSLAFARPDIKSVLINGFAPEPAHIRSGAYILSRPLLLVSGVPPTREVKQFLAFMVSPEGQAIVARNFMTLQ